MNGLYTYAASVLSGILWRSSTESTEENKQSFPLMDLATTVPEVFANTVSNCTFKDVRSLKITCKKMNDALESNKCQDVISSILFTKILANVHLHRLRIIVKDIEKNSGFDLDFYKDILEIISKNNPKVALEIISQFFIDNKSTISNTIKKKDSVNPGLPFFFPFFTILKNLQGSLKTTEDKKIFLSILENIFFSYDYDTTYVANELIDLLSEDADYIWNSENPNVVEFLNKWNIKDKVSLLIQLGDKAAKKGSYEEAKRFYIIAAERLNAIDLSSLNQTEIPNPIKHLALLAQIAKRIQAFDNDKANIILEKINEVYQKIEEHIQLGDICEGYDEFVEALPSMEDTLVQKAKILFSQVDNKSQTSFFIIKSKILLKELYKDSPNSIQEIYMPILESMGPQALLTIAEVAFSFKADAIGEQAIHYALSLQHSGCSPEFIKKLIELNKLERAISFCKSYERIDLLMLIASDILVSNQEKAIALVDKTLESLREEEKKEKNQSFFSKLVFVQDPTFSRADILAGYYDIINIVATLDLHRARPIAIEALKFREKYKKEGLLTIPCQALKCLFHDPMQAHFLLNNYTFSENEKTFFGLATLDQCKNSSIKTTFVSKLDQLNSSSGKEEE